MLQWLWKSYRDEVKSRKTSQGIVGTALATGSPFTYLREHLDDWDNVRFDDFMLMLRVYDNVTITSHEITDIYERWRIDEPGRFLADIARLLRDKHAELEDKDGRNTSS